MSLMLTSSLKSNVNFHANTRQCCMLEVCTAQVLKSLQDSAEYVWAVCTALSEIVASIGPSKPSTKRGELPYYAPLASLQ